jgi:hypothetical protein
MRKLDDGDVRRSLLAPRSERREGLPSRRPAFDTEDAGLRTLARPRRELMNKPTCSSLLLVGLLVLPLACSRGEPPAPSTSPSVSPLPLPVVAAPKSSDDHRAVHAVGPMRAIPKDEIPSSVRLRGEVERAVGWTDENGENLAVFSRTETSRSGRAGTIASAYLDVQHVVLTSTARPKILRSVRERVDRCDADLLLSFQDAALAVTDLDHDGIGELTFAYALACRTDMTPAALKLLMFENGDKYILRGTMRNEEGKGGDLRIDPSFASGAPAFLEHAKRSWQKVSAS